MTGQARMAPERGESMNEDTITIRLADQTERVVPAASVVTASAVLPRPGYVALEGGEQLATRDIDHVLWQLDAYRRKVRASPPRRRPGAEVSPTEDGGGGQKSLHR